MQQSFKKKEIESNWQHLRNIAKFQNWSTAIKLNRSHLEWWKNLNRYINNINTFTQKLWCLHGCNMVFRLSTIEFNSFLVCSWRNRLISKFFAIQYVVNHSGLSGFWKLAVFLKKFRFDSISLFTNDCFIYNFFFIIHISLKKNYQKVLKKNLKKLFFIFKNYFSLKKIKMHN